MIARSLLFSILCFGLGIAAHDIYSSAFAQASFGGNGAQGCSIITENTTLNRFNDGKPWITNSQRDFRDFVCSIYASVGSGGGGGTGTAGTFVLRQVLSGSNDTATTNDTVIAIDKSTGSPTTETIPACNASLAGKLMIVADEKGDAATNAITVTPASGTIEGTNAFVLNSGFMSVSWICDGGSNWLAY